MLVQQQLRQKLVRFANAPLHTHFIQTDPHRQGVDQRTHYSLSSTAAVHPSEHDRAKHRITLTGCPRQYLSPSDVKYARGAHPERASPLTQTPRQNRIESVLRLSDLRAISTRFQKTKRCRRLFQVAEHLTEEQLVFVVLDRMPHMRHKVPERENLRQFKRPPRQTCLHFNVHHFNSDVIQRKVVI